MKQNSLRMWLCATLILLCWKPVWSQNSGNTRYEYHVKFLEIQSADDLKNFDASLRPLFDVVGTIDPESHIITFRTNARLHSTGIEARLAPLGLHLEQFEQKEGNPVHSNLTKQ